MDGSALEGKWSFKMLGLTFFSKLDWGSYVISIAKTASKKIGALICSMKCLSSEVALYLYKSTIHPWSYHTCMEYCCQVWAGAPSCYLELLDKLQKCWSVRTASPSLATSFESLAHHLNAVFSCFYRFYFGGCLSELAELVPLTFSWGRPTCYSGRLDHFSITMPRCYKVIYITSFLFCTATLWNTLPLECFPLTYDLNDFKSRINRHLSSDFLYTLIFLCVCVCVFFFFFFVTPCLVVAVQPCMEWIWINIYIYI